MYIKNILPKKFSIKYKLLMSYIAVIIIPVLIGAYLPFSYTQNIIVKEADRSLSFSLDNVVELMKYKMAKYSRISNKLVTDYNLKNRLSEDYTERVSASWSAAYNIYNDFLRYEINNNSEEILGMRIYKKNDSLPLYGDYLLNEKDVNDEEWVKNSYANKGVSFWKHGVYKQFDKPDINTISLINIIHLTDSNALLEIELKENDFFGAIETFNYKNISNVGIMDETGEFIYQNKNKNLHTIFPALRDTITSIQNGSFRHKIEQEEYLIIVKQINFQGWKIVLAIPIKALYENSNMIKIVTAITVISCIIVFIFITFFLVNMMTSRLKKLIKRMRNIEEGNFNVSMMVKGNDEITELSLGFNSMTESIRNLIKEVYTNKLEKKEAELRALQEGINPHFLYNTLSSISWMAVQVNSPKIIDIVESLALFYRLSLNKGREIIFLKEEMLQVKTYVDIQKIRYEDGFEIYFDIDPKVENACVIKLIVQPFVENAIIHAFKEDTACSIYIIAKMKADNVLIRIIDNGKGIEKETLEKLNSSDILHDTKGYGIRNVNERIKLHYGETYGVTIFSELASGTVVEILLPFISEKKEDS